jgi:hypothetical protein
MVAIAIMAIAVVAVVGALLASVRMSDVHRKQATAGTAARSYAEQVSGYVSGSGYSPCAAPASFAPSAVGFSVPSGYSATAVTVRYWIANSWSSTCTSATDSGVQQVTVRVSSSDGRASEQVVVVVRKPCGSGSTCA